MHPERIIFRLLLLFALYQAVTYYPIMPLNVASHFDGNGIANGWMSRDLFFITYWLALAVVTALHFLPRMLTPELAAKYCKVPNRDYWLAPERREHMLLSLRRLFGFFSVALAAVLVIFFEYAFRRNIPSQTQIPESLLWITLGVFYAFLLGWLVALFRAFRLPRDRG